MYVPSAEYERYERGDIVSTQERDGKDALRGGSEGGQV
jgi:hypothetical protein